MNRTAVFGPVAALLIVASPAAAQWAVEQKTDPITDAASATLTLKQEPIFLQLGCEKGSTQPFSVLVGTTSYIGKRPAARTAIVRFDVSPPETSQWGHSANYALLLQDQKTFIAKLARSQKVALRLTSSNGGPVDLVFRTAGAAAQVGKFMAKCRGLGIS